MDQALDEAEPGSETAGVLAKLIVERSASSIELERAWLAGLGIESDDSLPAIEPLLHADTA